MHVLGMGAFGDIAQRRGCGKRSLLLQHQPLVGDFVALQPRQKRHAEQVGGQNVGQHERGHVVDGDAADFDSIKGGRRGFDVETTAV
jgi:hypothetical protein